MCPERSGIERTRHYRNSSTYHRTVKRISFKLVKLKLKFYLVLFYFDICTVSIYVSCTSCYDLFYYLLWFVVVWDFISVMCVCHVRVTNKNKSLTLILTHRVVGKVKHFTLYCGCDYIFFVTKEWQKSGQTSRIIRKISVFQKVVPMNAFETLKRCVYETIYPVCIRPISEIQIIVIACAVFEKVYKHA